MIVGLVALLIEVVSVTAAGKQLKNPITGLAKHYTGQATAAAAQRSRQATGAEKDAAYKRGISVLAATSKGVSR